MDYDEDHERRGEHGTDFREGAHDEEEAGLRGQATSDEDEHYQFDKKEREAELEESVKAPRMISLREAKQITQRILQRIREESK